MRFDGGRIVLEHFRGGGGRRLDQRDILEVGVAQQRCAALAGADELAGAIRSKL